EAVAAGLGLRTRETRDSTLVRDFFGLSADRRDFTGTAAFRFDLIGSRVDLRDFGVDVFFAIQAPSYRSVGVDSTFGGLRRHKAFGVLSISACRYACCDG